MQPHSGQKIMITIEASDMITPAFEMICFGHLRQSVGNINSEDNTGDKKHIESIAEFYS